MFNQFVIPSINQLQPQIDMRLKFPPQSRIHDILFDCFPVCSFWVLFVPAYAEGQMRGFGLDDQQFLGVTFEFF